MKFARIPKFALLFALAGALTLSLSGCGSTVSNLGLTQGNWAMSATSTAANINTTSATFVLGGNLTQSGDKLSGTLSVDQSLCISPQTLAFTGTVKGSDITLTSAAFDGNVISVTASGTKDSISGNYTITGGCADQGTIAANAVPSISGTWSGSVLVNDLPGTMSIVLTQASTASADGTFALTGTVTYSGLGCTSTLTAASSIKGGSLTITGDTGFNFVPSLDSITTPTSMTGDYDSSADICATSSQPQTPTLTKQ